MGETENPLHLRMNGHRSDYYRSLPDKPIAVHFNTLDHTFEDVSVMVIEQIQGEKRHTKKEQRELLDPHFTDAGPQGLNLDPWSP